eukprot:CAMPEP_0198310546 /NCGR_PEP_ID=MMETSP1450-20131203/2597_1 /TAXON_ID=753684 ORGANISM="Madagascaria erythrocladiodes, Strain CCMP3234" /NCGR_SAMPLE_ID=MMETSP1450 /ASSEMBLY_ACC=CAM_ASM_001115 /LENGTH=65 /DNA_ID=CAMNT_0044013385 /DNA_START=96 /DNA_END=293 /DNA_ORIENTATION=-
MVKNRVIEMQQYYAARKATGLFTHQMGRYDKYLNAFAGTASLVAVGLAFWGFKDLTMGTGKKEGY